MINRMAFNYDLFPAMLTDGFFWFKDLSAPDPYGILPLIGGLVNFFNILSTSTTNVTPTMRKIRKFIYILPFISVPIWMTFPAVNINTPLTII
jgi:membrane protein insertase Oxa1/YidC/SpoIIIJ